MVDGRCAKVFPHGARFKLPETFICSSGESSLFQTSRVMHMARFITIPNEVQVFLPSHLIPTNFAIILEPEDPTLGRKCT